MWNILKITESNYWQENILKLIGCHQNKLSFLPGKVDLLIQQYCFYKVHDSFPLDKYTAIKVVLKQMID